MEKSIVQTQAYLETVLGSVVDANPDRKWNAIVVEVPPEVGVMYLHLRSVEETDQPYPEDWFSTYAEQEVPEQPLPDWCNELNQKVDELQYPLSDSEVERFMAIPDPPGEEAVADLVASEPLYPEQAELEGAPLLVLFRTPRDADSVEKAWEFLSHPDFARRALQSFRCRVRQDLQCQASRIEFSQLSAFSLQGVRLAMRGLIGGSYEDLPDFLEQAIQAAQETHALRRATEQAQQRAYQELEQFHAQMVTVVAKALARCPLPDDWERAVLCEGDDGLEPGLARVRSADSH